MELQKPTTNSPRRKSSAFLLPKGLRKGPQDHMDVQIDTADFDPGAYKLLISQQDGKSHAVEFKILPNPPKIANLPIVVNQGAATQHFVLKGERLEQVSKLEAPGAVFSLGARRESDRTEPHGRIEVVPGAGNGTAGESVSGRPHPAAHIFRRARNRWTAAGHCEFQAFAAPGNGDRGPLRRVPGRIHA